MSSGYMKIYQMQEHLEEYIKIKQEWIDFSTLIVTELQLPIVLRQDAAFIIWKYKGQYIDLLKTEINVSSYIRNKIKEPLKYYSNGLPYISKQVYLADIIEHINEVKNNTLINKEIRKLEVNKDKFQKRLIEIKKIKSEPQQTKEIISELQKEEKLINLDLVYIEDKLLELQIPIKNISVISATTQTIETVFIDISNNTP